MFTAVQSKNRAVTRCFNNVVSEAPSVATLRGLKQLLEAEAQIYARGLGVDIFVCDACTERVSIHTAMKSLRLHCTHFHQGEDDNPTPQARLTKTPRVSDASSSGVVFVSNSPTPAASDVPKKSKGSKRGRKEP